MDVIVLAGGLGTRLRSAVASLPKILAPVGGRPFAHYLLASLERQVLINRVILATGVMGDLVQGALGDRWGRLPLTFIQETTPQGTGGALLGALPEARGEVVIVINGDTLFPVPLIELYKRHLASGAAVSLALSDVSDASRYGSVQCDPEGRIRSIHEKGQAGSALINAGVYMVTLGALQWPKGREGVPCSLERDLLPGLAEQGRLFGWAFRQPFIDIGTPEDFARAEDWVLRELNYFL